MRRSPAKSSRWRRGGEGACGGAAGRSPATATGTGGSRGPDGAASSASWHRAGLHRLPHPLLDGGHLFFLLIEKLKGSPVSTRSQFASMQVAMILFLSMALYVTWNDITRLFSGF